MDGDHRKKKMFGLNYIFTLRRLFAICEWWIGIILKGPPNWGLPGRALKMKRERDGAWIQTKDFESVVTKCNYFIKSPHCQSEFSKDPSSRFMDQNCIPQGFPHIVIPLPLSRVPCVTASGAGMRCKSARAWRQAVAWDQCWQTPRQFWGPDMIQTKELYIE